MTYVVEIKQQQNILAHYVTEVYHVESIRGMVKGKYMTGRAFVRVGDSTELVEGT